MDLFDNTVLCKNCGKKMKPAYLHKDGFKIRALKCPSCSNHILHPQDVDEYNKFKLLRNKPFQVKLRLVGNSYTVSIPREIIDFRKDMEDDMEGIHKRMQDEMRDMVTLAMQDANQIKLMFNSILIDEHGRKTENKGIKVFKIKKAMPKDTIRIEKIEEEENG